MRRRLSDIGAAVLGITVIALFVLGGIALVGGFLYAVWTGDWLGAQIALTGFTALAVATLAAMNLASW